MLNILFLNFYEAYIQFLYLFRIVRTRPMHLTTYRVNILGYFTPTLKNHLGKLPSSASIFDTQQLLQFSSESSSKTKIVVLEVVLTKTGQHSSITISGTSSSWYWHPGASDWLLHYYLHFNTCLLFHLLTILSSRAFQCWRVMQAA